MLSKWVSSSDESLAIASIGNSLLDELIVGQLIPETLLEVVVALEREIENGERFSRELKVTNFKIN